MTVKRLRDLLNQEFKENGDRLDAVYVKVGTEPKEANADGSFLYLSTHFDFAEWEEKGEGYAELRLFPVRDEALDPDYVPPPDEEDRPEEEGDGDAD